MGEAVTQIVAVLGALGALTALLLWRRQGRNLDADTRLKMAQAEVALSADARAWVEQYAEQATTALEKADRSDERAARAERKAARCEDEVRALRTYLIEVEAWARRNARPDAEPMPRLSWPLPDPKVRPAD